VSRDRGHYGPLDRDRHWAIGWAADRTVDHVRDRTVGAALRPVLPVISDLSQAARGADRWWTASRAIGGRAQAERPVTEIGQELFHTVADRERAIAQLSTGFRSLADDLAVWQTSNTDHPEASTTAQWLAADVTPTIEEWNEFVEHEKRSWWTKLATSWETFEQWWDRLKQLRSLARAHGISLQSTEPVPLPKTIWQQGAEGKGSEVTAILGVLKIGALSALAVMGAAGLYTAIRNLKARALATDDREAMRMMLREELMRKEFDLAGPALAHAKIKTR
jgi:hypothetical protein